MSATPDRDLLRRLALAAGPPGAEGEVREIVRETLSGVGELSYDRLGSVLCQVPGAATGPRVVLDGHMDEVGFMAASIRGDGRVTFAPLGGWWGHVLLAQRVEILTERGKVGGVIASKPPHFLGADERSKVIAIEQMAIDLGVSNREEAVALGVQVGDPIVPQAQFQELAGGKVASCKAFDNRVGIGLLCELLRDAAAQPQHPNTLMGVAAVQEEVGLRGARTASTLTNPDAAVILEATPADDMPGVTEPQGVLGRGPQIRFMDPTAIANRRLVRLTQEVAAAEEIPVQLAVRRAGGTNAGSIQSYGQGVPTVVIGVPARYIHTHVSLVSWQDYAATKQLVQALVARLDAATVAGLVAFDEGGN
ncbi:MAG: M42 family metallopeptidase [Planctomycetota bacterium]